MYKDFFVLPIFLCYFSQKDEIFCFRFNLKCHFGISSFSSSSCFPFTLPVSFYLSLPVFQTSSNEEVTTSLKTKLAIFNDA